jgi:membrane protein implicated in regulation of membrane protease activity
MSNPNPRNDATSTSFAAVVAKPLAVVLFAVVSAWAAWVTEAAAAATVNSEKVNGRIEVLIERTANIEKKLDSLVE